MPAEQKQIPDSCGLLRRITPNQVVPDKNSGRRRLSSGAFRDRELSTDAECLLLAEGKDASFSLRNHPSFFLVRIRAGFARENGQQVQHLPEADNYFHTEVLGSKPQP